MSAAATPQTSGSSLKKTAHESLYWTLVISKVLRDAHDSLPPSEKFTLKLITTYSHSIASDRIKIIEIKSKNTQKKFAL